MFCEKHYSFFYLFTKTETNYEEYIIIIYLLVSKK